MYDLAIRRGFLRLRHVGCLAIFMVLVMGLEIGECDAALITYDYQAVDNTGSGAVVTGQFGWDDSTVDDRAANPDFGDYRGASFIRGVVTGGPWGSQIFSFLNLNTFATNSRIADDIVDIQGAANTSLQFRDSSTVVLSSDALPSLTQLQAFPEATLVLNASDWGGGTQIGGFILTSITAPSAVPEPTTFLLLGIGIAGLAGADVRRRRKKKAIVNS